jgi:hypothetical protein
MAERIKTYQDFWPFYLGEHSKATTRWIHFFGTQAGLLIGLSGIPLHNPWSILGALVTAYGAAWFSHFVIEKNRPATFKYPLWSLISDFRMLGLMWAGRMDREVARHVRAAA